MPEVIEEERIIFKSPNWHEIQYNGELCVDMHFHTDCSDSYTKVDDLARLARQRKIGVAITDHNLIQSVKHMRDEYSDVFVIPGIEISTSDGPHILAYFYDLNDLILFWDNNIKPRLQQCPWLALKDCSTEKLMDMLEKENCITSAAHPSGYIGWNKGIETCNKKGYISDEIIQRLDAYEVICGSMTRSSNLLAKEAAQRHNLGYTGGTDSHTLMGLGNVVTVSDASDLGGFLDGVLKRKNTVIGIEENTLAKLRIGTSSLSNFMRYLPSASYIQIKQTGKSLKRAISKK